jgi:hypothetical protein
MPVGYKCFFNVTEARSNIAMRGLAALLGTLKDWQSNGIGRMTAFGRGVAATRPRPRNKTFYFFFSASFVFKDRIGNFDARGVNSRVIRLQNVFRLKGQSYFC